MANLGDYTSGGRARALRNDATASLSIEQCTKIALLINRSAAARKSSSSDAVLAAGNGAIPIQNFDAVPMQQAVEAADVIVNLFEMFNPVRLDHDPIR